MRAPSSVRSRCAASASLISCVLSACGGGGGSSAPPPSPPPPSNFTIGGSVSGLSGTVVLQQNGANDLSVSASGSFAFSNTVSVGGAYAVTVRTQPNGQQCTVSAGSGSAAANVSNVAVACVSFFTVGGTVSGLTVGAVVLQNNSGDNLSITANGPFTFSTTVQGGGAYSVSVLTQPPGPDCAVTSGAGTAAANVSNVVVVCTVNPATTFLPLSVMPQGGTSIGTLDLDVVTSKSMTSPPIRVATDWGNAVGYTPHFVRDTNGKFRGGNPAALIYASDTNNLIPHSHLFALDLTGASTLVPRQLSNLTVTTRFCEIWMAYEDLDDPASAFLLVSVPIPGTGNLCDDHQYLRIRQSDSAVTAPTTLGDLPAGTKQFLYKPDGSFAGMVVCDSDTGTLVMYHDDSFTTRTSLLDGCNNFSSLLNEPASSISDIAADPTRAVLLVNMLDGTNQIVRVDHTRTSSTLYQDATGFEASVQDDDYFYFANSISLFPTVQEFLRVRLDGTAPAESLYTRQVPDGETEMSLVGVSGDNLLLVRQTEVDPSGHTTSDIRTLSKLGPATPAVIGTYDDCSLIVNLYQDLLFIDLARFTPGPTPTYSEETTVLKPDGNVVQAALPGSWFIGTVGNAIQRGRDVAPGHGANLESLTVLPNGTLASTILKHLDGSPFMLTEDSGFPTVFSAAPPTAMGNVYGNTQDYGLLLDLSKSAVESVVVPNKNVSFLSGF